MTKTAEELIQDMRDLEIEFLVDDEQIRLATGVFDYCPITALARRKSGLHFDLFIPYVPLMSDGEEHLHSLHKKLCAVIETMPHEVIAVAHAADASEADWDDLTPREKVLRQELLAMVVCK